MAVRRVPEDPPDIQSAVNASAPGDRIEVTGPTWATSAAPPSARVTIDDLTIDYAYPGIGSFSLGPGVRSLALPGLGTFLATGNELDNRIVGGPGTGYLDGRGGDDFLAGGPGADSMAGGTGNDTYEVDNTTHPPFGSMRVYAFLGDQAIERLDEGWDAVWASVDFTLPAHVEGLVLTGGARRGVGNEAGNLIVGSGEADVLAGLGGDDELRGGAGSDTYLVGGRGDRVVEEGTRFGPGFGIDEVLATVDYELPTNVENLTLLEGTAAVWGSGNDRDNRIIGNELDNRLVGWTGNDTLTGGAGDDMFFLQRQTGITITDFWPGAGSNDQVAFPRDMFASREQAFAAAREGWTSSVEGRQTIVQIVPEGFIGVVTLLNTRLADLTLDDILIV
ncbi:hypothetical protein GCM10009416_35940 [Craurococcus roseus]|uniref:Calcium-binding protein n=1 Tax=Craurococcus roseus TaxID=77585 RepID=A0ABN1FNF6_9PROT